jgi:dTDP-glucose 4,6-dehydratase
VTRVLLTGAGGFVGHHTLEHILTTTDWEVICTDSFRHAGKTDRIAEVLEGKRTWTDRLFLDDASNTHRLPIPGGLWADRVTVVTHDLTVPFSPQLAEKIGPLDAIISMASESHVDRSISHPVPFVRNNVDLVLNLLEFQRTYTPNAIFLQVSTDEVYGPAAVGHNHREWETFYPSNPYSASKAAQESICFSYWRTFGTPLILTNTMNIIGERQDPEKYVPMVIKKVLNGEKVTIHGSKDGKPGSRYYLHARNQADALVFLLKEYLGESAQSEYGIGYTDYTYNFGGEVINLNWDHDASMPPKFHIVGEREVDNLEMATLIAEAVGKPLDYEIVDFHSSRPGHDLRYALDGYKMSHYGWKPPVPFEDSLRKTVKWTLAHPDWMK